MLEVKENEPLKNHSTFRIGGLARYFAVAKTKEEILEVINFAKEKNLPYFVFGRGSNILFRDESFDGLAIKIENWKLKIENSNVIVGSGVLFSELILKSVEAGLTGLEWGAGIPGTVGGCVAGNCGAYGHNISESVEKVITLDKEYSKEECGFLYRDSKFKNQPTGEKEIILEIELKLEKGDKEKSKEEIKKILIDRKEKNPPYPSIGCIFKNFKSQNANLKTITARSLIEECGLKGRRIGSANGGAQVSEQHPNFIVNLGNARAEEVLELINLCKQKVKEKFNLDLEEEIVII
ncbi:MAG: UDP-N-acetylmuramate dehydrogenase [Candidatus Terrybacteria bacterium]|nr:UDP-N-acetylmuramate dehydrogenase [Candidatus Terrybacteria bacterium]